MITGPLYLSSDSGVAKLGAVLTNIYLCWVLLYVPGISLGTEDTIVNKSIQRPSQNLHSRESPCCLSVLGCIPHRVVLETDYPSLSTYSLCDLGQVS